MSNLSPRKLRSTNKDAHPGLVDRSFEDASLVVGTNKKRKSQQKSHVSKGEKAAQAEENRIQREKSIADLAAIEDAIAKKVIDEEVAHPRQRNSKITKVASSANQTSDLSELDSEIELPPQKKARVSLSLSADRKDSGVGDKGRESIGEAKTLSAAQRAFQKSTQRVPVDNNQHTKKSKDNKRTDEKAESGKDQKARQQAKSESQIEEKEEDGVDMGSETMTKKPRPRPRPVRPQQSVEERDETPSKDKHRSSRDLAFDPNDLKATPAKKAAIRPSPIKNHPAEETSTDGDFEDEEERTPMPKTVGKGKGKKTVRDAVDAQRRHLDTELKRENLVERQDSNNLIKKQALVPKWAENVAKESKKSLTGPSSRVSSSHASSTTAVTSKHSKKRPIQVVKSDSEVEVLDNGIGVDQDEVVEMKAAVGSPVNAKKNHDSIVVIGEMTPPPKRAKTNSRKERTTLADLPKGSNDRREFSNIFLPTYIKYIAMMDSPWSVSDATAIETLKTVWDYVYGAKVPTEIDTTTFIFIRANQRLCEWRSGFGSTALSLLDAYFNSEGLDTDNDRKEFAELSLREFVFLYGEVSWPKGTGLNAKPHRKKVMMGTFVLQVLGHHITSIANAINVPSLATTDPICALALSAAAVERALSLWASNEITCEDPVQKHTSMILKKTNVVTGKVSTRHADFNQANWKDETHSYYGAIVNNIQSNNVNIDDVLATARLLLPASNRKDSTSITTVGGTSINRDDARFNLCNDEDSDADEDEA